MADATGTRAAQSTGEDQNRIGGDGTERLATSGAAFSFATSQQYKSGDGIAPAPIEQAPSGGGVVDAEAATGSENRDDSVVEVQTSGSTDDGGADAPAPELEEAVETGASSGDADAEASSAGPATVPAQGENTGGLAQPAPAIADVGVSAVQPGVILPPVAVAMTQEISAAETGILMPLVDVPVGAEELASQLSPSEPAAQSSPSVLDSFVVNMGTGLTFTLNDTGGVGAGTQALAGFQAAAALWAGVLTDNVNIVLDVGFTALDPGILGQASSTTQAVNYNAATAALTTDATSVDDTAAVANLQGGTSFNFASQNSSGTFVLDNNGSTNNSVLSVNTANAKALGIATTATTDASITFSTLFSWDFDQSDGVGAGLQDFVGVAFHEIGHALGFVSGVDIVDFNPTLNLDPFRIHSVLDLFRYSANTVNNFGGVQDLGYGTTSFFSVDGGTTNIGLFSTGVNNGDGQQASHWKDNLGIGIMDPTANPAGQINTVSAIDLRAFDAIGWNLVSTIQPVELFDAGAVSQGTFATIQAAEDAAGTGFSIVVDGATYTGNPENVTVDQNNLTFTLPTGVTPTITIAGVGAIDLNLTGAGNGNVNGNSAANVITGNDGNNVLNGNGGADELNGGAGADTLNGGAGADVLRGGDGDTIDAGSEDDFVFLSGNAPGAITGGSGFDQLIFDGAVGVSGNFSGAAFERIVGSITGGDGISVAGTSVDTILEGRGGNDVLTGGSGNDQIMGGADDDNLNGGSGGSDVLQGGAGNDVLTGGAGDALLGGTGNDTIIATSTAIGQIDGGTGFDSITFNTAAGVGGDFSVNGFEHIIGSNTGGDGISTASSSADTILEGRGGNDVLTGGTGNDQLFGGAGDDNLNGGAGGSDLLVGGAGNDILTGGDGDALLGGTGNDTIIATGISLGGLDGGTGFDSLTFNTATGVGGDFSLVGFEHIVGSDTGGDGISTASATVDTILEGRGGNDVLTGGSGNDQIFGGAGDDNLNGGSGGSDLLQGDAGNDILTGGAGDALLGGTGNDTIIATSTAIGQIDGGTGFDSITFNTATGVGGDFSVNGFEHIVGSDLAGDGISTASASFDTILEGRGGNDVLTGGTGNDQLFGGAGSDNLNGGAGGSDLLQGDAGNDFLTGGDGDVMLGGAGNDTITVTGLAVGGLDGGLGIDTLIFNTAGGASGDFSALGFETIIGSNTGGDGVSVAGTSVDTVFEGRGGNDVFTGGSGTDTAVYAGNQANFTIVDNGGGFFTITDNVTGLGIDTLQNVENAQFLDGTVVLI